MSFDLPLVHGHRLNGEIFAFPHRCPGADCRIAEWLYRKSITSEWYRKQAAADLVIPTTGRDKDVATV